MSLLTHRPTLRWAVPLAAALLLAAGGSTVGVIRAAASGDLPHRSAARLLVDIQKARLDGLSGTLVQSTNLGLPSLPGEGGSGSSDMSSLVSGPHTLRLWYAGPDHVRLALLGSLGESDIVRNGTDLWNWSSSTKSATHRRIPASAQTPRSLAAMSQVTPQQAAEAALQAISPTTRVHTDGTAVVADRSAYELVLRPRDRGTLVGSVRIAIDGRTHVPTRVQVFARGAHKPAFEVGFTSFDPTKPHASVFRFAPPPGTKVTQESGLGGMFAQHDQHRAQHQARPGTAGSARMPSPAAARPHVVGKGWTSVVVANLPQGLASRGGAKAGPDSMAGMLQMLPTVHGRWGTGHVLRGTLFSAVLTDGGRVAVGAVPPKTLYAALNAS
jgi:outer membrane lipoprotein-sorting protein